MQEVEVASSLCNVECADKNVVRRSFQGMLHDTIIRAICVVKAQRNCEHVARKIAQCNSTFRLFCKEAKRLIFVFVHIVPVFAFPKFMHETNVNAKPSARVKRFPFLALLLSMLAHAICIALANHDLWEGKEESYKYSLDQMSLCPYINLYK